MLSSSDMFLSTDANISKSNLRHINCSRSSECSSTLRQDSLSSVSHGFNDNVHGKSLRFPRKSIMTIRTQNDSVSSSEAVLDKRRRKQRRRHLELVEKGLVKEHQESAAVQLFVSFSLETLVREYAVGIVDNPSVSSGVPIGLVGECRREYSRSIHEYDNISDHDNLVLSPKDREMLLNRQGITWKEIHRATQNTNQALAERRRRKKWNFLSKTLEIIAGPTSQLVISSSQKKLIGECLEYSRRVRIVYDIEEEVMLSSSFDSPSLLCA